ncbi:MAG: hypothetical protein HY461_01400 [Parcubacteria group bacterium]|nr:hypothetical protein [Parcubacteria group bacterium]
MNLANFQAKTVLDWFGFDPAMVVIFQIGIRFLLAGIISVAGIIALVSAYNWINNENNEIKAYENKHRLSTMLVVITTVFVLMALFRMWVPDYQVLQMP